MNLLIVTCLVGVTIVTANDIVCDYPMPAVPSDWVHMTDKCVNAMREQIGYEMSASSQFLAMGAYFSRDSVNRPGFAELCYEHADEERSHGINIADYLLLRGELTSDIDNVFQLQYIPPKTEWTSVIEALDDAIVLEGQLTSRIRSVIDTCEHADKFKDYAIVDYLSAAWLRTQIHVQYKLARMISSLEKMKALHQNLGEFFADKQLLDGECDEDEDDDDEDEYDDDVQ